MLSDICDLWKFPHTQIIQALPFQWRINGIRDAWSTADIRDSVQVCFFLFLSVLSVFLFYMNNQNWRSIEKLHLKNKQGFGRPFHIDHEILTPDWNISFHGCDDRDKFDKCDKFVSRALLHCFSHSDNVGHHQMKFPQREIIRPGFWLSEPSTNSYVTLPHLPPPSP